MADKDRIHRWITQADLERMMADARRQGAEAMRASVVALLDSEYPHFRSLGMTPATCARLELSVQQLPVPEDKR